MWGRIFPASAHSSNSLIRTSPSCGISPHRFAGADAEHAGALDQQQIGAGKPDAAGEADHEQPRAPGDAAHAVLEDLAADGIEHHVGAAAVGDALDRVAERLAPVQHEMIGALRLRHRELFLDDAAAITVAPSSLPISTAASPTPPPAPCTSSTSPGVRLAAIDQRVIGGAVGGEERRALGIVERPWQRHELRRRNHRLIGIGAVPHLDDDAVADRDASRAFRDLGHLARRFHARRERQLAA